MKHEFSVALRICFFAAGATTYSLIGILPQLERSVDGTLDSDNTVVVGLAEVGKFVLSLGFLTNWDVRSTAVRDNFEGFKEVLGYFSLPALAYAVSNNLNILLALQMDAGTFQVVRQATIVSTSILWWIVFRKPLSLIRWIAIGILFLGSILCSLQKSDGNKSMGIQSYASIFLIVITLSSSTCAAVSTEWVYKRIPLNDVIYVHNCAMYVWGILLNGIAYMLQRKAGNPFQGFNIYTWLNVLNYMFMGLALSFIMKHFSNITKLFISGASMYISTLAALFLFHLIPSAGYCAALALVSLALVLYNWEMMFPVTKKEDDLSGECDGNTVIGKTEKSPLLQGNGEI